MTDRHGHLPYDRPYRESLEGMNPRIDPRAQQLVAAGPIVAAHAA